MRTILAAGLAGLFATMTNWFIDGVWTELVASLAVGIITGVGALILVRAPKKVDNG